MDSANHGIEDYRQFTYCYTRPFYFPFQKATLGKGHGGIRKNSRREESERLGGEGDHIEFIDSRFERRKFAGSRKGRKRQDVL